MQEPNDLETAIVVAQAPNPRAREILMPANQSMMVTQVGTLRPEFGNAVPTEGSLRFLQKYSREKMGWFVAGGAARRANPIVIFKMKALTRWLVRPLPNAIVGARDFVNAAECPPAESAEDLIRMMLRIKTVFPSETFDDVQGMYLYYADLARLYQVWVAEVGNRVYPFPRLPPLEQVKRQMLFCFYKREDRDIIGHRMTFRDGADDEEYWANYFGVKKYLYPRRAQGQHLYPPKGFCTKVGKRRSIVFKKHRILLDWSLDEKTFVESGEWCFIPRLVIARYNSVTRWLNRMTIRPDPLLVHTLVVELLLSMPM
jgi:hypothetical protein